MSLATGNRLLLGRLGRCWEPRDRGTTVPRSLGSSSEHSPGARLARHPSHEGGLGEQPAQSLLIGFVAGEEGRPACELDSALALEKMVRVLQRHAMDETQ